MTRKRSNVPRRKMKHARRGASVSVYLDFELFEIIRGFADREHINFNDAIREVLYIAAETMRPRKYHHSPTEHNTRKP